MLLNLLQPPRIYRASLSKGGLSAGLQELVPWRVKRRSLEVPTILVAQGLTTEEAGKVRRQTPTGPGGDSRGPVLGRLGPGRLSTSRGVSPAIWS